MMSEAVSHWSFYNLASLILCFSMWLYLSDYTILRKGEDLRNGLARNDHTGSFLHIWAKYIDTQPVQARDRLGFAEMGLRTQLYAQLLRNKHLHHFDYFEHVLWPFAPGIKKLREAHAGIWAKQLQEDKGVVICAGKNNYAFALHLVSSIRNIHHSQIPIEIYFYGDEDLPLKHQQYLTSAYEAVKTIDLGKLGLFDSVLTDLKDQGFALKAFALLATNFSEVMLADADTVFLVPPEDFFAESGYRSKGTLFFHDRHYTKPGMQEIIHEFLRDQLGTTGPSKELQKGKFWKEKGIFEQESGVVLVDKRKSDLFAALLFTAWQNTGEVRDQTTYRLFWGDKETFWLAFELAEMDYHFDDFYAGAIGKLNGGRAEGFCAEHPLHSIVKPGSARRPAWFNGSLLNDKKRNRTDFLQATTWALDGAWAFIEQEEAWCLQNYTSRAVKDSGLDSILDLLVTNAKEAEQSAQVHHLLSHQALADG